MQSENKEISLGEIKRRIIPSFLSLTARQIILRALSFISINIVLAKVLPVETLGIFNIAVAIITFFAFFSDIGLAAALIQKKDEISDMDIKTTFTIQQLIVGLLSLLVIAAAPFFGQFYRLDQDGVWLIRSLGLSFFLSSLKVIPSVLLERELRFKPIVLVEAIETVIFNMMLITLVIFNFGIWSFSISALVRGITGVLLIFYLAPVKISLGIDKGAARQLLSFGLPFQTNSLLALLKDRLVPLVIAKMVGPVGVGYITWSQSIAYLPLEIMSSVIRISFPAFSRLQKDKKSLEVAVEKALFVTSLTVYPAIFGFGAILPSVVKYVVSDKWQPAVLSFYLFSFSSYWAVISTTLTNTLNAIGQIKTTLKLMIFWTLLTWILTPVLVFLYGYIGVGLSSFFISFTSVITIILVKKVLEVKIINSIFMPTLASSVMGLIIFLFSNFFVRDKLMLVLTILLGVTVYGGLIFIFSKERLFRDLKSLREV